MSGAKVSTELTGRKERVQRIDSVLRVCQRNNWTYDTPDIAGKVERILVPSGFTRPTLRDYVRVIIDILEHKKKNYPRGYN